MWWESIEWVYEAYEVEIEHDHWPNAENYTEQRIEHRWVAQTPSPQIPYGHWP